VIIALKTIAARRSDYTLHVAISQMDDTVEPLLDVNEAYKRLQIHQQSAPDSTVFTFYSSLSGGASAGSKDSYKQALRAIAHHRQSNYLLQKLEDPNAEVKPEEVDLNQPAGLNNIGNTCYLNSLLQYFYTIKPVRDVALNIDEYRLPLNDEDIKNRRAGGRQNTRVEIAKGQRCECSF
jgi:ubiquitin carboxyl-terminal hydrolase 25/28